MKDLNDFYLKQDEPIKGIFLAMREIVLNQDSQITNSLKYGMPFFSYKGKMFCYLWMKKKTGTPYLAIVEGKHFDEPFLKQENRSRMKIMLIQPNEDLPLQRIETLLQKALDLYRSGEIKIK